MAKYLGWFSATAIALAGLVIGILPVDFGARWIWFTIGVGFGFLAAFTFPRVWGSTGQTDTPLPNNKVEQNLTMKAGKGSTQIVNEGGGTFEINKNKDS